MTCEKPVRECLAWHIKPNLANAKISKDGQTVRGRCPECGSPDGLTVSAGERTRVVWNCFGGCGQPELWAALTKAGILSACLPRSRAAHQEIGEAIVAVIQQGTPSDRAVTILRAYLIALGHIHWPKGAELIKLAGEAGVGRTVAFDARKAGPLVSSPRTSVRKGGN